MADGSRVLERALGWTWRLAFVAAVAGSTLVGRGGPASASPCDQATITWDGGANTTAWTTAANWSGDRLPTSSDHVCIPAGSPGASVVHSGTSTIQSLEARKSFTLGGSLALTSTSVPSVMTAGTIGGGLQGPGEMQINGTVNWSGGEMSGNGTTRVLTGSQLNITYQGCCSNRLVGWNYTLVNDGTLAIDGGEGLNFRENFNIQNNGLLTWAPTHYSSIDDVAATGTVRPSITNTGTIVKTTGADKSISVAVWNKSGGVVKSDFGSLLLQTPPANPSSGTFAGGVILYGAHPLSGATFTGLENRLQGTNDLPAGTTTTVATGSTMTLAGNVNGPGKLRVEGTINWTGGELKSNAVTEIAPGGRLSLVGKSCCSAWAAGSNATIVNNGTLNYSGAYGINFGASFKIENNATLEFAPGTYGSWSDSAAAGAVKASIVNTGTIVKTVAGDKTIGIPVWNKSGATVKSDLGTLMLQAGSDGNASSGTFSGVVLYGTHPLSNATFTGTGNKLMGTHALAAGTTTTVASGSTTLTGYINGPGKLIVGGTLDWTSGELKSWTTLEIAPAGRLNMIGSSCCSAWTAGSNATVVNDGTLAYSGSYGINFGESFRIENRGTLDFAPGNYGAWYDNSTATATKPQIVNTGTIVKTVAGDRAIQLPVWNQAGGTVKSNAGGLLLQSGSGGNASSGTFAGGVTLYGTHPLSNAAFSGTGNKLFGTHALARGTTTTIAAGTQSTLQGNLDGPGKLLVRGTLDWAGGEMRTDSSMYVTEAGRLNVTYQGCCSNRAMGSNATVVNDGAMFIEGGEGLDLGSGFAIYNNGRLEWNPTNYSEIYGSNALIANAGTFVKVGSYERPIYTAVENDGTIEVQAGGLSIQGRFRPHSRTRNVLGEGEYLLKGVLRASGLNVARNAARITLDGSAAAMTDLSGVNALRGLIRNAGGGRLTLKNGATVSTFAAVRNAGKITVEAGSTFTTPGYTQVSGATVLDGSTSTLAAGTAPGLSIEGGSLRGTGVVQGTVTNSGGTVMPGGTTPGTLTVQGNYTQTALGSIDLDVAGTSSYDSVAVTGAAAFNGRLALLSSVSYVPVLGDAFTFLTYGSQTGAFASFSGTSLPGGLSYSIQLQPQSATAVVQ